MVGIQVPILLNSQQDDFSLSFNVNKWLVFLLYSQGKQQFRGSSVALTEKDFHDSMGFADLYEDENNSNQSIIILCRNLDLLICMRVRD